jgi:Xaa-Pro dipeptidase
MAQIKNREEIQKIFRACKITDQIFDIVCKNAKSKTEIELHDFILDEIKKRGLKPSFDPIVTSGVRAGNEIHPKPTNSKLSGFVIVDFGVVYKKYMSDMTRMLYVGVPTKPERDLYNLVLLSHKKSARIVYPGIKCALADKTARNVLGKYNKYFIHTLGHGVGTKIHEYPKMYYKIEKPIFKSGMVITIEPGIYIKGRCGIRIEDTYLVTQKGLKPMTNSTHKLVII